MLDVALNGLKKIFQLRGHLRSNSVLIFTIVFIVYLKYIRWIEDVNSYFVDQALKKSEADQSLLGLNENFLNYFLWVIGHFAQPVSVIPFPYLFCAKKCLEILFVILKFLEFHLPELRAPHMVA